VTEQLALLRGEDPDDLVARVRGEHDPTASYCLFSGGNDSTVLAHRCREHYDALAYIDTGTAIPGVRDFVERYAAWLEKPLRILEHDDDAYRRMVLGSDEWWAAYEEAAAKRRGLRDAIGYGDATLSTEEFTNWLRANGRRDLAAQSPAGFPGPASHRYAYIRLKERQLERLVREAKRHPRDRLMLLTGVRRAESVRRMGTTAPIRRDGAQVWVAPRVDWSNERMRAYRAEHALPQSDVAALLHRSGECNCGAFAAPGEREDMEQLYPTWFDERIGAIEREAVALGIPRCRWGDRAYEVPSEDAGPPCSDCQLRFDALGEEAA
jgi:3'-phosphoadenosine 5'-phosphosulfate sulfotransferase (PAPS reductase)/FAD synthetase